jgi:hypothetical protein
VAASPNGTVDPEPEAVAVATTRVTPLQAEETAPARRAPAKKATKATKAAARKTP